MFNIKVERIVHKPIEEVFAAIADHANYGAFPGVKSGQLIESGEKEPNGLGALRRVEVGPFTLFERIVGFQPPYLMQYKIEKASPIQFEHEIGEVKLVASGDNTLVTWKSNGHLRFPILGGLLDKIMQKQGATGFASILKAIEKT